MQNQKHSKNPAQQASGQLAYAFSASASVPDRPASLLSLFVMGWMHRHQPNGKA